MASHSRPPPPPPPPGGPSSSNNTSSGPTAFYASHSSNTSSSAARQRLGLNKKSARPMAGAATTFGSGGRGIDGSNGTTAGTGSHFYSSSGYDSSAGYGGSGGGGTAMTGEGRTSSAPTTDDWFGSGPSASSAAASASAPSAPAPASASGFYGGGSAGARYPGYGGGGGSTFYGNSAGAVDDNAGYSQYDNKNTSSSGVDFYSNPNNVNHSNAGSNMYGNSSTPDAMNGLIGSAAPSNSLSGPMTSSHTTPSSAPTPSVFDPNAVKQSQSTSNAMQPSEEEDYENEPPLLEELGVNFPHIYSKSRAVLFPTSQHAKHLEMDLVQDTDLAGPLAFALGLAGELLLSGKMHFGYVYGFVVSGSIAMTLLLNLLNPNGAVSMWMVVSILGYALLPVNLLAGINIVLRVAKLGWTGMALAMVTIGWCTVASTRLFERGCGMRSQRFLVAYPVALLYSAFVMITIF
ncbi:hypothetical protein ACHAXS_009128 [Conticribra weissflogii]